MMLPSDLSFTSDEGGKTWDIRKNCAPAAKLWSWREELMQRLWSKQRRRSLAAYLAQIYSRFSPDPFTDSFLCGPVAPSSPALISSCSGCRACQPARLPLPWLPASLISSAQQNRVVIKPVRCVWAVALKACSCRSAQPLCAPQSGKLKKIKKKKKMCRCFAMKRRHR